MSKKAGTAGAICRLQIDVDAIRIMPHTNVDFCW
jgi:hypothetical protein